MGTWAQTEITKSWGNEGWALYGWIRRFLEVEMKKQCPGLGWVQDWGLPTQVPQVPTYLHKGLMG